MLPRWAAVWRRIKYIYSRIMQVCSRRKLYATTYTPSVPPCRGKEVGGGLVVRIINKVYIAINEQRAYVTVSQCHNTDMALGTQCSDTGTQRSGIASVPVGLVVVPVLRLRYT